MSTPSNHQTATLAASPGTHRPSFLEALQSWTAAMVESLLLPDPAFTHHRLRHHHHTPRLVHYDVRSWPHHRGWNS